MKYSVDRVEENIIVLQDLDTEEIKEIDKSILDFEVSDGDILIYKDNNYYKDEEIKEERLKMMQEKLDRLKGIK